MELLLPGPATGARDGPADALVQRIAGQLRSAPPPAAGLARKLLAIVDEILGGPAG